MKQTVKILLLLLLLNSCNTVKGAFEGATRDAQSIWHYGSCAYEWESGCQKK
jgi:predicted small secreted protein